MTIPLDLINMVAEYQSGRADGMTREALGKQLAEIRDYLNGVSIVEMGDRPKPPLTTPAPNRYLRYI